MMSGRWLRIAPELSSTPLQTMSYCQARMSSGSLVSSASSSPCGMEKGLCEKSTFFASSSYSNIGKSTIQQNSNRFSSMRPRLCPSRVRAAPASLAASASLPAAQNSPAASPRPRSAALAGRDARAAVEPQARLGREPVHALGAMIFGDWPAPLAALARRVAEPGIAFAACPIVHVVEELAALPGGVRRRDRSHHAAAVHDLREQPKA